MDTKLTIRLLALLFVIVVFVSVGTLWWFDATSSVNTSDTSTKIFVVNQGEGVRSIATRLKAEGLIRDPIGFFLQVKLLGIDENIQAGDFRLSPSMKATEVAQELTHGSLDVWVTILEGWRNEEVALKLAQDLSIPEQEFLALAQEGYMFPDTYLIPREASASAVVNIFEENFNNRVTGDMVQAINEQGLTFEEGIVLASLVEREGRTADDRPIIAGILLNRLREGMPLQVDATLQYVLGYQSGEKTWWKKSIYNDDKTINSPYNTYQISGLPPAPICNPGLAAINAVAYPTETDYFYYIHDPQGMAHYAMTLDEHNENVATYLQ